MRNYNGVLCIKDKRFRNYFKCIFTIFQWGHQKTRAFLNFIDLDRHELQIFNTVLTTPFNKWNALIKKIEKMYMTKIKID